MAGEPIAAERWCVPSPVYNHATRYIGCTASRGWPIHPRGSASFCRWDGNIVAVVTGANKGLGYEAARILGREGLHVVVTARNPVLGEAAVVKLSELEPAGTFTFQQLDITDPPSVSACADFLRSKFGKVDILLNNAGIAYKGNAFGAAEAQETIDCNLKGTRAMSEAVLPLMKSGGAIVNVCSLCVLAAWHAGELSWLADGAGVPATVCAHPGLELNCSLGTLRFDQHSAAWAGCSSCRQRSSRQRSSTQAVLTASSSSPISLWPRSAAATTRRRAGRTACTASPSSQRFRTLSGSPETSPRRCAQLRCPTHFKITWLTCVLAGSVILISCFRLSSGRPACRLSAGVECSVCLGH